MTDDRFLLTKIIATLGPSSSSVDTMTQLISEGVRVFRINFSHGSFEDYAALLTNIRKAEAETGKYIGVLGDLSGPKIRVGKVIEGGIHLEKGNRITFVKEEVIAGSLGKEMIFSSTFPGFIDEVNENERVIFFDLCKSQSFV